MGDIEQIIAELDQHATDLENWAKLLGGYFVSLRKEGIPGKLAALLVRDYYLRTVYPDTEGQDGEFNS